MNLTRRRSLQGLAWLLATTAVVRAHGRHGNPMARIVGVAAQNYIASTSDGTGWQTLYASWSAAMPSALKTALAAAGFKDIRLAVNPIPFFTAADDATILSRLNAGPLVAVADLTSAGFNVTFDFHIPPSPSVPSGWGSSDVIAIASLSDTKFARMVHCGTVVANALVPYMPKVRFEVFNEWPVASAFTGISQGTQGAYYYNQIRPVVPTMPLIVSGVNGGAIYDTTNSGAPAPFDPTPFLADPKAIISIHDYTPTTFTAQDLAGGQGTAANAYQYINRLPFPPAGGAPALAAAQTSSTNYINADTSTTSGQKSTFISFNNSVLATYFNTPQDVAYLQSLLHSIRTWADAHGVPVQRIVVGECGCVGDPSIDNPRTAQLQPPSGGLGANATSRANYYNAVTSQLTSDGIGFSIWDLSADFFEITDGASSPNQALVSSIISSIAF
jgi:hypothetical protein